MDQFEGCSVIFHNVNEWYSPKNPIRCQFSVKEKSSFEDCASDCFVGVFPVGWDNLLASITKKSFSIVEFIRSNNLYQIEFLDHELPEAYHDEFYQFCFYNMKTEHVYGASCPFQIYDNCDSLETFVVCGNTTSLSPKHKAKVPLNGSTNQRNGREDAGSWGKDLDVTDGCDDDLESFMVVTKQVNMKENFDKMKLENELLQKNTQTMKHESEQFTSEIKKLENEAEIRKHDFDTKLEEFERKLNKSIKENEQLAAVRTKVNLEKDLLQTDLQTIREQEEKIKFENKELRNDILSLKQAIRRLEEKHNILENENQRLLSNYQTATEEQGKVQQETKFIEKQLTDAIANLKVEKQKSECLHVELDNVSNAIETLEREKLEMETAFNARENNLSVQITDLTNLNIAFQNEINEMRRNIASLVNRETQIDLEKTKLKGTITEMEANNLMDQRNCNETIAKLKETVETQAVEIYARENQIEELEEIREDQQNKILKLNYLIENEITSKQNENEEIVHELQCTIKDLESKLLECQGSVKLPASNSEVGAFLALQLACRSLEKQLKETKQENRKLKQESHDETNNGDSHPIVKENDELRMRLCMAKKVYEKKHKEWQNLKEELAVITTKNASLSSVLNSECQDSEIEGLKQQITSLSEDLESSNAECEKLKEKEIYLQGRIEEFKEKSMALAQHFEGKFKLLEEENNLLKKQQHQVTNEVCNKQPGPAEVPSVKPRPRPVVQTNRVEELSSSPIFVPPSHNQQEQQQQQIQMPQFQHFSEPKPDIAYPPSMNKIDRDQKNAAWLPAVVTDSKRQPSQQQRQQRQRLNGSVAPTYPPPNQFIGNREPLPVNQRPITTAPTGPPEGPLSSFTLQGRGVASRLFMQEPAQRCPVCEFLFPPGYSEIMASAHVNEHF